MNRPLPYSLESEMALLGALLLKPSEAPAVFALIRDGDFHGEAHAALYRVLREVYGANPDADLVPILDCIRSKGLEQLIGAPEYLEKLMAETPSGTAAPAYAAIVARKAKLRRLIEVVEEIRHEALGGDSQFDDSDKVFHDAMAAVSEVCRVDDARSSVRLADAERDVLDTLQAGAPEVHETGIGPIDRTMDGFPKSGVVVVGGYPGGCKTTTCLNVALHRAQSGLPVRVFSYEQRSRRIAATILASASGSPVHEWLNRGWDPQFAEVAGLEAAIRDHEGLDFRIIERNLDAPGIFNVCAGTRARGVAVVDYVQDLPGFGVFQEQTPKISESMRWLARIARDLGWLVLAVSQLDKNAGKENRRPRLSDGLGSSAIEQRGDFWLSVWRPFQQETPPAPGAVGMVDRTVYEMRQRCVEFGLLKSKFGPLASCRASFDGRVMRFGEPSQQEIQAWKD